MRLLIAGLLLLSVFSLTVKLNNISLIFPDRAYGNNESFITVKTEAPEPTELKINGIQYVVSNGTILIPFSRRFLIENGEKKDIRVKTVEVNGRMDCSTYERMIEEEERKLRKGYGSREVLAIMLKRSEKCRKGWEALVPLILALGIAGDIVSRRLN